MASYLGNSPETTLKVRATSYRYVATSGQTVFSGTDSNNLSMIINLGDVEVFLNGVMLDQTDYTYTNTSVTLTSGATVNDIVEIITNVEYATANVYSKEEVDVKVNTAVTTLIGTAGTALDTLGELSDALNDDANYAATVTTALGTKVAKTSSTGSAQVPVGSTAQRDGTPAQGYFRFNSSTNQFEGYNGTAWGPLASGSGGAGTDASTLNGQSGSYYLNYNNLSNTPNLSTYATLANPTFTGTVNGITATMVGLGNVTNESKETMFTSPSFTGTTTITGDGNRLVSSATQTVDPIYYYGSSPVDLSPSAYAGNYTAVNIAPPVGEVRIATTNGRLTLDCDVAWGMPGATFNIYGYGQINFDSSVSSYRGAMKKFRLDDIEFSNTSEILNTKTGATSTVTHDFRYGAIWYHISINTNFTANFTNVPTTNNRTIVCTLILSQGSSAYIPNAVQIAGSAQTIKWLGGSQPTGNVDKVDIVSFTLIRANSAWTVLGSLNTYG